MASRIEDYALIGDCHTAALVSREGSIDWLCLPRFDSGACFAALLGDEENGRWMISPSVAVREVRRRYLGDTLILETDFVTAHGIARVTDFMPPRRGHPQIVRLVEGVRGQVPMQMDLVIRFDYGSIVPWVRKIDGGIRAIAGPDTVHCVSEIEFRGQDLHTQATFNVSEGQTVPFSLTWSPTHEHSPRQRHWKQCLTETEKWWREWASRCTYQGEWKDAVLRSLLTLRALIYEPTGGIVAAPTTSLPEFLGGARNWDYRYCWVRDAAFTLQSLIMGGYHEEAGAWRKWLLRAVAGTPSELQIMYGLGGERRLTELSLPWLSGYSHSAPVRIGNAAHAQSQLDVYGEFMDTVYVAHRAGLPPTDYSWQVQLALLGYLEKGWRKPDHGIWEVRGEKRHFTHSKVMAWVALDRGIRIVEEFGLHGDADKWRALRDEIHAEVCRRGFDTGLNSFVQYYGSRDADASLLVLATVGFLPAADPRIRGTVKFIQRELTDSGLIRRYRHAGVDGLPPGEGCFLPCTFWLVNNLALLGRHREARQIWERLLDLRNDVGLLPEEYDPAARRFLGNFPQAFTHVSLLNAARFLSSAEEALAGPTSERSESFPS